MKRTMSGLQLPYEERIALAAKWIKDASHLVVMTGAGISTESGLPDFRGIWESGETTRLHKALAINWNKVEPNKGHLALVRLQDLNILKFLISQNIDNLHLTSGIRDELLAELHGNVARFRCNLCGKKIPKSWDQPAKCSCGGLFEASIIRFHQKLPKQELDQSFEQAKLADVFLAIGSSLITLPAGNLPRVAKTNGAKLIIINRGKTNLDGMADLRFTESIGEVMTAIMEKI